MLTTFQDAGHHAAALFDDLTTRGHVGLAPHAVILYHQDGFVQNLAELALFESQQTKNDIDLKQWLEAYFEVTAPNGTATDRTNKKVQALAEGAPLDLSNLPSTEQRVLSQVTEDVTSIRQELRNGHPVLLVSHSLGNMYANAAVREVERQLTGNDADLWSRLRAVGLGVPAGRLSLGPGQREDASYITYGCDGIINSLRLLVSEQNTDVPDIRAQWKAPLRQNFKCFGLTQGNLIGLESDFMSHGIEETYINAELPINQAFLKMVRCTMGSRPGKCPKIVAPPPPPNVARAPQQPIVTKAELDKVSLQPKTTKDDYPKERMQRIFNAFEELGTDVRSAAMTYAERLWDSWQVSAAELKYTPDVESANYRAQAGLVCLIRTMGSHPQKSALNDRFLIFIQSTLADDVETFKKYFYADTLANHHPMAIPEDRKTACRAAGELGY